MDRFAELLLEVWREVGRHIEIRESAQTLAGQLAAQLPLERLLVLRFDATQRAIETVAVARPVAGPAGMASAGGKSTCTASAWKRLMAWVHRGEILRAAAGRREPPSNRCR